MNKADVTRDIIIRFNEVLNEHSKHMECFCTHGVQLEGWLKGELLCFLDEYKASHVLVDFDREVLSGTGKKKVDFCIKISTGYSSELLWLEIKHWLIGYQKGSKYNSSSYFGDPSSVGIKPDVEKLLAIEQGSKYLLILATANPGDEEWLAGVSRFNTKFSPLSLNPLTKPSQFPATYFLGFLSVKGAG